MGKKSLFQKIVTGSIFFWLTLCLVSCGREEELTLGIDGYVYVAEQIPLTDQRADQMYMQKMKSNSGYLYYVRGAEGTIRRVLVKEGVSTAESEIVVNFGAMGTLADYMVDEDGTVYGFLNSPYYYGATETKGGNLFKQLPNGELAYKLPLPDVTGTSDGFFLAMGNGNRVYLLTEEGILQFDDNGTAIGKISTEDFKQGNGQEKESLVEGEEGRVYYCIIDNLYQKMTLYEIQEGNDGQLVKAAETSSGKVFGSSYGVMYVRMGDLYQYRSEDGDFHKIMRMQDSNLSNSVYDMAQISENIFAAYFLDAGEELYSLVKTKAEDLPHKEILVLAVTVPSYTLTRSVTEFNRTNDKYHIMVEYYQGEGWEARLDSRLVSSNPPDLLDMTSRLSIMKYANKQALEDLKPFLENSTVLQEDDFLENVLDGYTVDGRLLCIPSHFYVQTLMGRSSQVGQKTGWTMEELQIKLEEYSNLSPVQDWGGYASSFENILHNLCVDYILDCFVDLEAGDCDFDGEEFYHLVEWIKSCSEERERVKYWEGVVPNNLFLVKGEVYSLSDGIKFEYSFGEEVTMIGYPAKEGEAFHRGVPDVEVCITANSDAKEGAWEFLEYLLTWESELARGFPSRKDALMKLVEEESTPEYWTDDNGEIIVYADGEPRLKWKLGYVIDGEVIDFYFLTEEQATQMLDMIEHTSFSLRNTIEQDILDVIQEEMPYYITGAKSLEEVTDTIQNRVKLMLSEWNG